MVFGGLQKVTLLDYPEKTACTIFTTGCNLRCPFCQNSSLVCADKAGCSGADNQTLNYSEINSFLETRKGLLDGVCISGGEPLLHKDLHSFIREVKEMGFLVKLDTNGSQPEKLKELMESGYIDYIAMDVKNTPEKYAQTVGVPDFDISPVKESVGILLSSTIPYEFRTTVVREFHDEDDLVSIAHWISGAKHYYLQGFINSGGVLLSGLNGYTVEEMHRFHKIVKVMLPTTELRGI